MVVEKWHFLALTPVTTILWAGNSKFFKSIFQFPITSKKKGRKYEENIVCGTPGFSIFFAIVVYWSNP
jgi:hypothetical protein